ncbi:unnamed protein product [Rhizoctonia solani]|uniref:BTB domain-containing protein n=1 Tax=Rhizoctonia solani TaxID=456999 RepID=A0A8H3D1M7_9AGAM|nr:unnamed protein product [Rhizoctonia solani]
MAELVIMPSLDRTETELVSFANGREAESSIRMLKANVVHPEFAFEDANIEVQTSDRTFCVHEFQLNKFTKIRELIQEARKAGSVSDSGNRVKIVCDGNSMDFYNTFRVLYSLAIFGVPEFQVDILISTLRIASAYDYAELKRFATDELEKCSLSSIDQIKLSDECFLPHWEKPAFVDLCYRTEPITRSEAEILGLERFVELARVREAQQCDSFVEIPGKTSTLQRDTGKYHSSYSGQSITYIKTA